MFSTLPHQVCRLHFYLIVNIYTIFVTCVRLDCCICTSKLFFGHILAGHGSFLCGYIFTSVYLHLICRSPHWELWNCSLFKAVDVVVVCLFTMPLNKPCLCFCIIMQGMKLLPTGRKNSFYLVIYGSVLGAGSFLVNQCLEFVNSILVNFGISREMHNPVAIFLLVGIILAGAGFGYWLVRKFVVSEDGTVDIGIAQSVKWGMRMIGVTFILQVGFQCTFMTWIMFIR
ncbi:uncharacterized protein LOC111377797 isoform X1 [Olea europaea var. sylvestris]|uniref:uncharacterized protein LOC111377797 isoform X1 n=1 Tax=Olea europaea var. sylvestris TaxID=158386 RepID=UPI000C1D67A6|nr:uncharacterized protein LOC111377797 isoform X1 [Olea europaea var. sylvestris]